MYGVSITNSDTAVFTCSNRESKGLVICYLAKYYELPLCATRLQILHRSRYPVTRACCASINTSNIAILNSTANPRTGFCQFLLQYNHVHECSLYKHPKEARGG